MELPPYRLPTLRSVIIKMTERAGLYLRKAGTTILGISILLWAATSFPKPSHYAVDAQIASGQITVSAAGATGDGQRAPERAGRGQPARRGKPGTFGRRPHRPCPRTCVPAAGIRLEDSDRHDRRRLPPRKIFVAQMGIVYSISDADKGSEGLRAVLARDYSPLVGLSMMLFLLIATPCMATVAVTRRESGKWSYALLQLGGLTGIAYGLSLVVYQVGRLFI
jgi:ferrous iron transport protein B